MEPGAQVVQFVEPDTAEKVLGPHRVHASALDVLEKDPAGHEAQLDELAAAAVPDAQAWHAVVDDEKLPAGQPVH
jgi:hypothetical protein